MSVVGMPYQRLQGMVSVTDGLRMNRKAFSQWGTVAGVAPASTGLYDPASHTWSHRVRLASPDLDEAFSGARAAETPPATA